MTSKLQLLNLKSAARKSMGIVWGALIPCLFLFAACGDDKPDGPIAVTGVTLSTVDTTLAIGETFTLMPTVLPPDATDKTVTWSSSANSVATVDSSGLVTTVAGGTATITVTTNNNFKAFCTVACQTAALGVVSFATDQEWTIPGGSYTQVWSDAVMATGCNKTTFRPGGATTLRADCRTIPDHKGHFFSWTAVDEYAAYLCPAGWRVPTRADFVALDEALGGAGTSAQNNELLRDEYVNTWGADYGGCVEDNDGVPVITDAEFVAFYWASDNNQAFQAPYLEIFRGAPGYPVSVGPGPSAPKYIGMAVRCIKEE